MTAPRVELRRCAGKGGCGEIKPLTEFAVKQTLRDGRVVYRAICKPCRSRVVNAQRHQRRRHHHLAWAYGLTEADEARMLTAQSRRCAVCDVLEADAPPVVVAEGRQLPKSNLVVDHDHAVDDRRRAVRGLVCQRCNRLLSYLDRLPPAVWPAVAGPAVLTYLTDPPARAVLGTA